MGRKILQTSVTISLLTSALTVFCLTQDVHTTTFALGIPIVRMDLTLTAVSFSLCGGGMLPGFVMDQINDMCHKTPRDEDLHHFSQATCSGAVRVIFPTICEATQRAYICGLAVVIACVINVVCQVVGSIMAYQYIEGKVKKQYRKIWGFLVATGTFIQFASLVMYYGLASRGMDEMRARTGIPLTVGSGVGIKVGFMMLLVCVFMQAIALMLTNFAKVGYEGVMEEQRENAKFMEEAALYNQALAGANSLQDGAAGGGYGAAAYAPQPGYGQDPTSFGLMPAPPPAMGMQQPSMQPAW